MTEPVGKAPKLSRTTIVLAEDDLDQRFLLAAMLRADGYHVTETDDGAALRSHLRQVVPPMLVPPSDLLVVCDLRLRGPDALTVLRELRTEGRHPRFILVTGFWDGQVFQSAKELGALAVFAKPFDFQDLRVVLRYLDAARGD